MIHFLNSLKLTNRLILIISVTAAVVVGTLFINFGSDYTKSAEKALIKKAAAFTSVADETKNHVAKLHEEHVFDMPSLQEEVRQTLANNGDYKQTRFFKTIPIVAGWTAAGKAAQKEHIAFNIVSFDARNPEHKPDRNTKYGAFRTKLLQKAYDAAKSGSADYVYEFNKDNDSFYFMRPIKLQKACMTCHGDPATSPTGDGKDMLGFRMENWKPGDVHGAYEVVLPKSAIEAQVASFYKTNLIIMFVLLPVAIGLIIYLIKQTVIKPIYKCVDFARTLEEGDLSKELEHDSTDEIGDLIDALNGMVHNLRSLVGSVVNDAVELTEMSNTLLGTSNNATTNADSLYQKSASVASAAEELSVSMATVSETAQQATMNINQVASATDQMTSTVAEISSNTSRAQGITHSAVATVEEASGKVNELGNAAKEITNVIEVINEISEQTKLLALNATIEAARAGEAGKGFAVVANEVKELAKQTNDAIENIKAKIDFMQSSTEDTISAINSINAVINEVNDIVTGIASAVEEQSVTTRDIANNVNEAASGVNEVTTNINQAAGVTQEVAQDISLVDSSSGEIKAMSENLNTGAGELSRISNNLKDVIERFKVN